MASPPGVRPDGLRRKGRLRKRKDFERAYRSGTKIVTRPLVLFARANARGANRLGVTATKKIGNAVIRNRARRLVREAYRQVRRQLTGGYDLVVVVRPPLLELSPAELAPVLASAFERAVERQR